MATQIVHTKLYVPGVTEVRSRKQSHKGREEATYLLDKQRHVFCVTDLAEFIAI